MNKQQLRELHPELYLTLINEGWEYSTIGYGPFSDLEEMDRADVDIYSDPGEDGPFWKGYGGDHTEDEKQHDEHYDPRDDEDSYSILEEQLAKDSDGPNYSKQQEEEDQIP